VKNDELIADQTPVIAEDGIYSQSTQQTTTMFVVVSPPLYGAHPNWTPK